LAETNRRLHVLNDAANLLLMRGDPERFVRDIFEMFSEHLGLEVYFNYWVTDDGTRLQLHSYGGVPEEKARKIEWLDFGQAVCGVVAQERRQIVAENIQDSDDPKANFVRSLGITAYACQPLQANGRLVGTLSFGTRSRSRFLLHELELIQTACNQVAVALDRARLFAALRQREAELVHRADQLQEADRQKDLFLAMLAHELRNPLAPIRTAASLLRFQSDGTTVQRTSEIIERQTAHLAGLMDDLLDVSRITRGKVSLKKVTLDLTTIISNAVESCRPQIEERGHHLSVSKPEDAVLLDADPDRLEQVLSNLLLNAVKFTPHGGDLGLTVDHVGEEVAIRVWDTGEGMDPNLLPHVFDLFTQGDRSLDRSKGGLGIGLSLVKGLVERHGGKVEAHSDGPGRGSVFTVRLPAHPSTRKQTVKHSEPESVDTPPLRILLVEDNEDAAEMLASLLELHGHEVRSVHDGPSAITATLEYHPQVVLMDIGLPGMDGYQAAQVIRERIGPDSVKLIALTGYGQEEDRVRSSEAGFDHHLVKPFDPDELHRLLAGLV
ncbi:MAG: response regulator, partial [Armatimonadetes bacterium]|nr:response regulator [Armatimonadota bacterium]